jgi:hypothetical protein
MGSSPTPVRRAVSRQRTRWNPEGTAVIHTVGAPPRDGSRDHRPVTRRRTEHRSRWTLRDLRRTGPSGALRKGHRGGGPAVDLEIRAGEVETIDGQVGGIAVNIGARVGARAGSSEVGRAEGKPSVSPADTGSLAGSTTDPHVGRVPVAVAQRLGASLSRVSPPAALKVVHARTTNRWRCGVSGDDRRAGDGRRDGGRVGVGSKYQTARMAWTSGVVGGGRRCGWGSRCA